MLKTLHHIGMAVPSLDAAMQAYRDAGHRVGEPFEIPGLPYRLSYVQTGGTQIDLVEPRASESTAGRYLRDNPDGGVYHLAYEVDNLAKTSDWLKTIGATVIGSPTPRREPDGSLVLVFDARRSHGTMLELRQPA
jgi:methylmalonyl-CoA/ethylmalonyl-CoA epimerase